MNDIYYLSHGGPGSGRYPWGSGDRPYQRLEGKRAKKAAIPVKKATTTGGISGYITARKLEKTKAEHEKAKQEAARRRMEEERKLREFEADKERVLREGTATEVLKYQGKLTNKELSDAADRLRLENQLSGYSEKEVKTALDKLKKLQSYTNVGAALAKDGVDLYNSFASIYNATSEGKKKPLTIVRK